MSDLAMFSLSEEHKMIRDAARDFAQKEIVPVAAEFDESGEFPHATIKKMGEMGFMGIEIPEEYGGAGMDTLAYVLALEEICKADASHGVIMSVNNSLYCHGIMKFGTEEQKQKFVTPIASGQAVGAYSLDGTTKRLRRRDDAQPRHARRRLVRVERPQILGDEWSRGRLFCRLHDDRPGEKAKGDQRLSGGSREYARPDAWQEGAQAGDPCLGDQRADLRELPHPGRESAGPGRGRLQDRHDRPGCRPDRDRHPGAGDRGGGLRSRAPVCASSEKRSVSRSAPSRERGSRSPT